MSPESRPCRPCATRGIAKPATRVMEGGMGKCEECFRGKVDPLPAAAPVLAGAQKTDAPPLVMRAPAPRKEKAVPVKKDIDWLVVQNERSDGAKVVDLAKKYGVHPASIYNNTKGAPGEKRGVHMAADKIRRPFKARPAASPNGRHQEFDVAAAIAGLKSKREKIDRSIAALEELL